MFYEKNGKLAHGWNIAPKCFCMRYGWERNPLLNILLFFTMMFMWMFPMRKRSKAENKEGKYVFIGLKDTNFSHKDDYVNVPNEKKEQGWKQRRKISFYWFKGYKFWSQGWLFIIVMCFLEKLKILKNMKINQSHD